MPTIKTAQTINFTQIPNSLIASQIPLAAKAILNYLLSKPKDWLMRRSDLKRTLGLTGYAIQKGLKWLQNNGYAFFVRVSGYTTWHFFDTPQTPKTATSPAIAECIENQYVENRHGLQITETETNKNQQHGQTDAQAQNVVVLSSTDEKTNTPDHVQASTTVIQCEDTPDNLIYPENLDKAQRKSCKRALKRLKNPDLSQDVLFALAYAMTSQQIRSVPAYLNSLVNSANDGTFTPVSANGKPDQQSKPIIPIWKPPVSNPSSPEVASGHLKSIKDLLRGIQR